MYAARKRERERKERTIEIIKEIRFEKEVFYDQVH